MPESKNLNAETVVQSRFNDVQKKQFINMDANITELQKIVTPLYEDYYSAKNAYDKKLLELNDSKLSATSPEFIAKKKELDIEYSDVVKKSQAYNNAKETRELIKLLDARSSLFSTYIATHGAVSVGRTAKNDIPAVTRQITNVAAGSYDTDVVNVAQLKDLQKLTEKTDSKLDNKINENTKNIKINRQQIEEEKYERVNGDREAIRVSTNYTDKKVNNFEQRINSNVNKRFTQLKDDIDKNKKRSDAGIAGAMAMTGIPSVPNKTVSFGMAMAGYRSEGAIAAGFHINTSENSAVKVNTAWDSQSGLGVSAGMALGW
ncbi:hemagglutinin [Escherichia coli]|nr:hemagglutinin [Escherichia coli]